MIASLPMYDLPALQGANDRYWQAIRARLGQGPERLTRGGDLRAQWLHPDLVLSQTCGYPYRAHLHGKVTLVGTPDYRLPGCPPGHYRSIFVARADDARDSLDAFRDARFAFNEALSQSGWAAPLTHARALGFAFEHLCETGGHLNSALAVAEGQADLAALDALTWVFLQRHHEVARSLKEVDATVPTPVLPYICAKGRDGDAVFSAIALAITDLSAEDRQTLHLRGILRLPPESYLAVATPPPPGTVTG